MMASAHGDEEKPQGYAAAEYERPTRDMAELSNCLRHKAASRLWLLLRSSFILWRHGCCCLVLEV